ncbi:Anaerobic magnesium-protoporphyrin IX monomethyl ester cyclase [Methylococcales bacterium]|nr:Anaerobic magnesium-protoporphyrin IX monomethyl ester cyclase [Methylococcales bacterium]
MNLLLINPYFEGRVYTPSIGLLVLATTVRREMGIPVRVLEPSLQGYSFQQVVDIAKDYTHIGISCYTESRFSSVDLAQTIKGADHNKVLIFGGPHVTSLGSPFLKEYSYIDFMIRSDGEKALLGILKGSDSATLPGLVYRGTNGQIVENPIERDKKVNCLDIDYDFIEDVIVSWKDFEVPGWLLKKKHLPVMASMGCPFQCRFCAAPELGGGLWRGTEPSVLVDRMERLIEERGIGYFRFYDPLFTANEKKIQEFCKIILERKISVNFRVDIRVGTRKNTLELLKKAGCDVVGFGVETGSDKLLKVVGKGVSRRQVLETIQECKALGFWIIGFFIYFFPHEDEHDRRQTMDLFKYFDVLNIQFFKIYPGTSYYQEFVAEKFIHESFWFDRSISSDTYFCKDTFPSAEFSINEGMRKIAMSYDLISLKSFGNSFKRNGWKALMSLAYSAAHYTLLRSDILFNLKNHLARRGVLEPLKRLLARARVNPW